MAQSKELVYTVKIKTEGGDLVEKQVSTLNELEQSAKDVEEALKKAPLGSQEWKDLNKNLSGSNNGR